MEKDTHDYLNTELDYFQKAAETQFNHFMQVFYFWTAIVTAPVTAGLLVNQSTLTSQSVFTSNPAFSRLLVLIAIIGWFLAAKMFDIRCSQLTYISEINQVRGMLYEEVKDHLPKRYELPYPPNTDLRAKAFRDFGLWMAVTMSGLDSIYLGFGIPLWQGQDTFNWYIFLSYFIFGILTYFIIIWWRGPKPKSKHVR